MTRQIVGLVATAVLMFAAMGVGAAQQPKPQQTVAMRAAQQRIQGVGPIASAYTDYARILKKRGARGLRSITTPDFAFRWRSNDKFRVGDAAFAELEKYADALNSFRSQFKVKVLQLLIQRDRAIAYTEESVEYQETLPHKKGAVPSTTVTTRKWRWKQIWRRTNCGWKLASWVDFDPAVSKLPADPLIGTVTFTVTPP